MIIVLKSTATKEDSLLFKNKLEQEYGVKVNEWTGVESTVLGLIGDTTKIDIDYISAQDIVESVKRVQEPYKKANRKFHPDNTVISFDGGQKSVMAAFALWQVLAQLRAKNSLTVSQKKSKSQVLPSCVVEHSNQELLHMLSKA